GGRVYWVAQQDPAASDANPGTQWQPWKTVSKAAATLQPGDVVVIRAGTYRETVRPARGGTSATSRITYLGYPGETVVITGADVQTGWVQEGHLWWVPYTQSLPLGDPAAGYGHAPWIHALRREQVIQDGRPLRHVMNKADLVPGTFWVQGTDVAPTRIYVRTREDDNPNQHLMEIGRRSVVFAPASGVQWLRVKNLIFRFATDQYHQSTPAFSLGAANGLMEDSVVEWFNLRGITVNGSNHVWRRVVSQDNGQIGWAGSCTNCLIEDSKAFRNNWKMTAPGGEAGGTKFAFSTNVTLRRFESAHNQDCGVWWDINNNGGMIEDSLIYDNLRCGILLELNSNNIVVRNNVVVGTRLWTDPWGGRLAGGIIVQGSSNNTIVHNTVYRNAGVAPFGGISLGYQDSRTGTSGNRVYNNISVNNGGLEYTDPERTEGGHVDAAGTGTGGGEERTND
ncbi:MAG TPA: right-handed parallel beta-helix repeat-containing protein, partial [Thermodesulfobacteriota bacterium]